MIDHQHYILDFATSAIARWGHLTPWELVAASADVVRQLLAELPPNEYLTSDEIAAHPTAIVERGAVLKGPLILGPGCFVAAGAYLRGGCWLARDCIIGPSSELKSSFVFAGSRLTHFNFVGDSILGANVNLEAGSIVCNARNERSDKEVQVRLGEHLHRTGSNKFGALLGDGVCIGANAVLAPGSILRPDTVVRRASLCDQEAA
ncbi:LpxA family transferase [Pigmentiphaga aceris]|uniref:LpxA family transferase n=1 Tax=Pigmentiphaga aceris TaxID=1940612 RepID=A0A5C0AVY5_9BURK|nr:LpxA family transferase [Pigmentiphaga aceris]QEI06539.1 LpxA family transferase [Pigmentiphaga aceris]